MKFNCGLSKEEKFFRRREQSKLQADADQAEAQKGGSWFAWRPVRIGRNDCRWLEYVHRSFPSAEVCAWFMDFRTPSFYFCRRNKPKYTILTKSTGDK